MTKLLDDSAESGFHWEVAPVRRDRGLLGASEMSHEKALDGLRAIAVLSVVFFHARFSWMPGGFLGVSTFFTLSGFLITSLLLREWSRRGSLDMRTFWRRRFRRLLPASWATMGLVLLAGAFGVWTVDQRRSLRGDVPFSLAEIVNWHFIAGDRSYGSKFEAPSPLEHFWSLSVEQQFYVLLPLLVLGTFAVAKRRGWKSPMRLLVGVLGFVVVTSAALNWSLARNSIDRAYFGTDTRAAELAIGALLACACVGGFRLRGVLSRRLATGFGIVGFGVSVALWCTVSVSSQWLYPWGLLLTAAATSALILGGLQGGVLSSALSVAPLVWLGGISYGVYLLHWPIFLWLSPARTGLGEWPLFGLRMLVTVLLAMAMYRLVEQPVRVGNAVPSGRGPVLAGIAAMAILGTTLVSTSGLRAQTQLQVAAAAPVTTAAEAPIDIMVLGDRLAGSLTALNGIGVGPQKRPAQVRVLSSEDCGLVAAGWVSRPDGTAERDVQRCGGVREQWIAEVTQRRPDAVVLWAATRDVRPRRMASTDPWLPMSNPQISEILGVGVGELITDLKATGAKVVVMNAPLLANNKQMLPAPPPTTSPIPKEARLQIIEDQIGRSGAPAAGFPENDPALLKRWNGLLRLAAARHGALFLDAATRMADWAGGSLNPKWRTDGVGLSPDGAERLAPWLLGSLRTLVQTAPTSAAAAPTAVDAALPAAPPASSRRVVPAGNRVKALVVGDSVALNVGDGLRAAARDRGDLKIDTGAQMGCPIARGGRYRFMRETVRVDPRCDWSARFPALMQIADPDVIVLVSGIWEVVDRILPADDQWRHLGEPAVDAYILREFVATIDLLGSRGAKVVLLTFPHVEAGRAQGFSGLPESDPARMDNLNALLRKAAALRPGVASVVEFQAWLASQPGGEMDATRRPDGIHFVDEFLPQIGRWLSPQLVQLGRAPSAP